MRSIWRWKTCTYRRQARCYYFQAAFMYHGLVAYIEDRYVPLCMLVLHLATRLNVPLEYSHNEASSWTIKHGRRPSYKATYSYVFQLYTCHLGSYLQDEKPTLEIWLLKIFHNGLFFLPTTIEVKSEKNDGLFNNSGWSVFVFQG